MDAAALRLDLRLKLASASLLEEGPPTDAFTLLGHSLSLPEISAFSHRPPSHCGVMSQKQSDGGQKQFSVGRGLLAAAETLNFSMNEQRPSRPMGGVASGMMMGMGGAEGPDGGAQMSRRGGGGGGNLGSTMKLFASLGLSPSDLDALAEIPEDEISVETLPRILMQLKSRKGEAVERRASEVYPGGRDGWEDSPVGRMGGGSLSRAPPPADFGFTSMQDISSGRGYSSAYGGGRAERPFSELPSQSSYGGLGAGLPRSDPVFMQRRMGSPSHGKVQDFLGVAPAMFPHVCSLCDFDVHASMVSTVQRRSELCPPPCVLLSLLSLSRSCPASPGRSSSSLVQLLLLESGQEVVSVLDQRQRFCCWTVRPATVSSVTFRRERWFLPF